MRRLCLIGFVMLLAAACHDSTTPAPVNDLDAIQRVVRVEPGTIVAGTSASVVLTLTNSRAHPVEISGCPIYFWVQGKGNQIVGGSNGMYCFAASLVYIPLRFDPFETKTLMFTWSGAETQNVPAGAYDVFGWVNDPAHASAPARITVQSSNQ